MKVVQKSFVDYFTGLLEGKTHFLEFLPSSPNEFVYKDQKFPGAEQKKDPLV
jgi:hypothetical protein